MPTLDFQDSGGAQALGQNNPTPRSFWTLKLSECTLQTLIHRSDGNQAAARESDGISDLHVIRRSTSSGPHDFGIRIRRQHTVVLKLGVL